MVTNYPINPRIRAVGKARLDFAGRIQNPSDWEKQWVRPSNSFPFVWGESWKQCVEYRVDDFPAEVGFFIDVLGLSVNALDPDYAMFTSPRGDFFFSILPSPHSEQATPPNAIRLQFMVKDIILTTQQLQQRGISFDYTPQPLHPGSSLLISSFRTPHGISIELWGKLEPVPATQLELNTSGIGDNPENRDDDETKKNDESDAGDEDKSDEDDNDGEDDGSSGNAAGNGDESDDDDEVELAVEGNSSDEEEDLGGGEEFDEEEDDRKLDEEEFDDDDDDFDDDDYGSDWDEDEDDDEDEDLKAINSTSAMDTTQISPTSAQLGKPASPSQSTPDQAGQAPEYIDLDIT